MSTLKSTTLVESYTEHQAISDFLKSKIIKRIPYRTHMSFWLIEKWAKEIPSFKNGDFREWRPTPLHKLNLKDHGCGFVYIKDESDVKSNPTGTIKDRAAWEYAKIYRDFALLLLKKWQSGQLSEVEITEIPVPRLSLISAGNEGTALAHCFQKYDLPPPKIIIQESAYRKNKAWFDSLRADIYMMDLSSHALTPRLIKMLSENDGGIDLTSIKSLEVNSVLYQTHVHEVFNENPDEIYMPFGSGKLMENFLTWQMRAARHSIGAEVDPRLKVSAEKVTQMNIMAAEPESAQSIADKLAASFKPFLHFHRKDISALSRWSFTGKDSERCVVEDSLIIEAKQILDRQGISSEHSAAAGLALYMKRFRAGKIPRRKKVMIINTGRGAVG